MPNRFPKKSIIITTIGALTAGIVIGVYSINRTEKTSIAAINVSANNSQIANSNSNRSNPTSKNNPTDQVASINESDNQAATEDDSQQPDDKSDSSISSVASADTHITEYQKEIIRTAFDNIKRQQKAVSNKDQSHSLIVAHNGAAPISILPSQFYLYKGNLELIQQLNDSLTPHSQGSISTDAENENSTDPDAKYSLPSDTDLIKELLKKELTVQYAKEHGISVSEQEIEQLVKQEKDALYHTDTHSADQQIIREIMDNRVRITGLSREEFWNSSLIQNEYRNTLYIDKWYQHLQKSGELEPYKDLDTFQNELLQKNLTNYTITTDNLN